ncbi:MAG: YqgE/AlgH family protein [Bacteroidota bacterium]
MEELAKGQLLIADPFLNDPNFLRSVVLLCEHSETLGSLGFVLNQSCEYKLGELMRSMAGNDFPVFIGGPVQKDHLFFIHTKPGIIPGGLEIIPGIFWGGDMEEAFEKIKMGLLNESNIKFFLGYSGWEMGQLEHEMELKSWLTTSADAQLLFTTDPENIWRNALQKKGGQYAQLIHYPIDPMLN